MKRFNRLKYKAIVYFWSITFSSCSMRSFSDISLYRFLFCVFSSPLQTNSSMNQSIYFRFIQLIHTPFCNQHTIFCPILYYCLQRGSFSIFLLYGFDFYHRNFFSVYYSTMMQLLSPRSFLALTSSARALIISGTFSSLMDLSEI